MKEDVFENIEDKRFTKDINNLALPKVEVVIENVLP